MDSQSTQQMVTVSIIFDYSTGERSLAVFASREAALRTLENWGAVHNLHFSHDASDALPLEPAGERFVSDDGMVKAVALTVPVVV